MLEIVEFVIVLLPASIYLVFGAYYYWYKLTTMNVITSDSSRLPASILVKADCFVTMTANNIVCMILSRVLSTAVIWQSEYPVLSPFYLVDGVAWLVSVKLSKMEFEREIGTHMASRAFWASSFTVAVCRLINPW